MMLYETNSSVGALGEEPYEGVPVACIYLFLAVGLGIVLVNMLILLLLCTSPSPLQGDNIYMAHLCAADLLVGLGLVFWAMTKLIPVLVGLDPVMCESAFWLCATSQMFSMTSLVASVLCIVVISAERYVKVTFPLRHSVILGEERLRLIRFVTWIIAVVVGLVFLLTSKHLGNTFCRQPFHTSFSLIFFFTALIVLSYLHFSILKITFSQRRRIRTVPAGHVTEKQRRHVADVRLVVMVGLLFSLLYVCWLPSLIVSLTELLTDNQQNEQEKAASISPLDVTRNMTTALRYLSTVFNPLIFNMFNKHFRRMLLHTRPCAGNKTKTKSKVPIADISAIKLR